MSKVTSLYSMTVVLTSLILDYVSVVIGIFVALLGTYWLVRGKSYEGPVSLAQQLLSGLPS
jgi:hypothetical protein